MCYCRGLPCATEHSQHCHNEICQKLLRASNQLMKVQSPQLDLRPTYVDEAAANHLCDAGERSFGCAVCQKGHAVNGGPLLMCGGCKSEYYCCPAHQRQAWKVHKHHCKEFKTLAHTDKASGSILGVHISMSDESEVPLNIDLMMNRAVRL